MLKDYYILLFFPSLLFMFMFISTSLSKTGFAEIAPPLQHEDGNNMRNNTSNSNAQSQHSVSPMNNDVIEKIFDNKADVVKEVQITFEDDSEIATRSLLLTQLVLMFMKCDCKNLNQSCECCFTLQLIKKIPCCLMFTYSQERASVEGNVAFGNKTIFNFFVSVTTTRDTPTCFSLKLPVTIGICLQFYELRWNNKNSLAHMCSKLEVAMLFKKVYSTDFGCFNFGKKSASVEIAADDTLGLRALGPSRDRVTMSLSHRQAMRLQHCFLAAQRGQLDKPCL